MKDNDAGHGVCVLGADRLLPQCGHFFVKVIMGWHPSIKKWPVYIRDGWNLILDIFYCSPAANSADFYNIPSPAALLGDRPRTISIARNRLINLL